MTSLPLLILGLGALWAGALVTVRGAVEFAEIRGLSKGFVGLAVLAIGTDLPELVVAIGASVQQLQGQSASALVLGSAIGSAVAQGTLVIGIAGLVAYMPIAPRMVRRDAAILLVAIAFTQVVALDGAVDRFEGGAMVLAYVMYLIALYQAERGRSTNDAAEHTSFAPRLHSPLVSIGVGMVIVTASAHLVVTQVMQLAESMGVGQGMVAVMLVGLGTSLPELALSVRAASDGQAGLSVGNIIGSNIFDLLIPVGVGAAMHPLIVEPLFVTYDIPALFLCTLALVFFLVRRRGLQRSEAIALVGLYVGYASVRLLLG